ncbi:lipoyl(octanoyl) transferase [Microbacterium endophyticum]|uniref:Octanoyltransferase n=1 Tax=Microbacterium endophyticum TaxID=1526412 RepID=A0A7W4V0S0_9MICO|nr:lipoyl(octanoyl) transferase [Microbacterium endophyticum]NIK36936.1 lipoyl(octanoyl) transferase [Microbacterium endophyticum]
MIDILTAGLAPDFVPYASAWALQKRIHASVVSGDRPDTLMLLEHEAVYTAGTRTEPHERPRTGTEVIDVDRGGKITWHGPGQLVGYPIFRLSEPIDVVAHVRRLERLLINALATADIEGYQVAGRSGVWVSHAGAEDKIAAIGVRVEKGVTMHGFAVNCSNTLDGFAEIIPCGITDAGVTTVSDVLGCTVHPRDLVDAVASCFKTEYAEAAA